MKKFIATCLLSTALMAGAAHSAPLISVIGADNVALPIGAGTSAYNPTPSTAPDANQGDIVQNTNAPGEGLTLDGAATAIFTFLGKEAGFVNVVFQGVSLFDNLDPVGTTSGPLAVSPDGGGFLPFKFISDGIVDLVNGAITAPFGSIAFKILSVTENTASVLALLNDHFEGDADYDDMVVRIDLVRSGNIDVPLPAGLLLLLSGLAGLGFVGRSRAKNA